MSWVFNTISYSFKLFRLYGLLAIRVIMQNPGFASLIGVAIIAIVIIMSVSTRSPKFQVLTDPFLQLPMESSINVVWFTEGKGQKHFVLLGSESRKRISAKSKKMSRLRDGLKVPFQRRNIWRHEAIISGLKTNKRIPYSVVSEDKNGKKYQSNTFTLTPLPQPGSPVKVLLTSDHQLKKMTPANMQKVIETVGQVDAVFFAGDLVNIPDNAEEWFDHPNGLSFFPAMQGRSKLYNKDLQYGGGSILQYAPVFTSIGNHEVMGVFNGRFADYKNKRPRWFANWLYEKKSTSIKNAHQSRDEWIRNNSYNMTTYKEIFSRPENENYYSQVFGNIHLISLFTTRPWRTNNILDKDGGKYHEAKEKIKTPEKWKFGDFLFERFDKSSKQYQWLEKTLTSENANKVRYQLVMTHQVSRGLGENTIPLMTDQILTIVYKDKEGEEKIEHFKFPPNQETWTTKILPLLKTATEIRYDYPKELDHWKKDIEPLLESNDIDLVFHGHSHLWYRLKTKRGLNYLETSNVGNSYGGYLRGYKYRKFLPPDDPRFYDRSNYSYFGDPYDGEVIAPNIFNPTKHNNNALPFVDSNRYTVFTILDSGKGVVTSYIFDTSDPKSEVKKFDEFKLGKK